MSEITLKYCSHCDNMTYHINGKCEPCEYAKRYKEIEPRLTKHHKETLRIPEKKKVKKA